MNPPAAEPSSGLDSSPAESQAKSEVPDLKAKPLPERIRIESEGLGRVDTNPKSTENRLREWAGSLKREELSQLKGMVFDTQRNGDERALAVYLLGLAPGVEAMKELSEIAQSPIPESPNYRTQEFEMILRAQAVEGLIRPNEFEAARRELAAINGKTSNPFVLDRSQRGLQNLLGHGASLKEQDLEAESKLLRQ